MSNFICEKCGAEITKGPNGHYITGCKHYPINEEERKMEENKDYEVIQSFYIAGVKFHQLNTVIKNITVDDHLPLTLEPTNKFDPNAIRIEYHTSLEKQAMLGYVPKKYSAKVNALVTVGECLDCVVIELNPQKKPWERIKVEIRKVTSA